MKLLVFRGHEVIGEYPFNIKGGTDLAIKEVLGNLKSDLSGVILNDYGVVAHSANLPKDNVWFNSLVLHV
jgi:hypothetical protein